MNSESALTLERSVVTLCGVGLRLGQRQVLQDLDLDLARGTICVLYGANGAGKSSLLKLLAGLQGRAHVQGRGVVLGEAMWPRPACARARLGYMAQQGGLYEELSVRANLEFRAAMLGQPGARARALTCAHEHGLTGVLNQAVGQLSGGWKQRVAFAVTLLAGPALLLLDEPTAGVDLEARAQIWTRISQLAQTGTTVLVSTHDAQEAARAHQLVALQGGRIIYRGAPADLCVSLGLQLARVDPGHPFHQHDAWLRAMRADPAIEYCEAEAEAEADGDGYRVAWRGTLAPERLADMAGARWHALAPSLEDGLRSVLRANGAAP